MDLGYRVCVGELLFIHNGHTNGYDVYLVSSFSL